MKRLNHLVSETDAVYHEAALRMGMSDSTMQILYILCDRGGDCPLGEICSLSGISKQTINSAILKMEEEGILYLEATGLKNKKVCLTEEGRLLMERTAGRVYGIENDILESWPQEDVQAYLELTERFLYNLRERAKDF